MNNKPKFLLNMHRDMFDYCFSSEDRKKLSLLVELIGGIPSKSMYTKEWIRANIKEAEGCITGWESIPIDEHIINCSKSLKIIFHTAGTVRGIFNNMNIKNYNLRIVSNAGVIAIYVARFTLGLILSGLKGVYYYNNKLHKFGKGGWDIKKNLSHGYYKKKIGIISLGHIGYRLIGLLKNFDFEVLVYSNHLTDKKANELEVYKTELDELMAHADVVVLLAPDLPNYHHMINGKNIQLLKNNAIFINVARGGLVEEKALIKELRKGFITAFLDVTDPEPPEDHSPFYDIPNCILTPHIAGCIGNECYKLGENTLEEIKLYMKNEPLKYEMSNEELNYRA
ncbi:MAG: hydroxyacid dehydrogenase [Actinomycetota bacterium]|nr:hydroxyacid dehydrogenase [Actinomycetota bacterium]